VPSDTCSYCGHDKKKYFAQMIANGKKVVAQRCANCLRSWKGQPFVSVLGFDWNSLPRWGGDGPQEQKPLFESTALERPQKRLVRGQIGYKPPELPK